MVSFAMSNIQNKNPRDMGRGGSGLCKFSLDDSGITS